LEKEEEKEEIEVGEITGNNDGFTDRY